MDGCELVYMCLLWFLCLIFFFKQKTAYEMRISDWSSDVCSSDLGRQGSKRPHGESADPAHRGIGCPVHPDRHRHCHRLYPAAWHFALIEIGRASCRERVCQYV